MSKRGILFNRTKLSISGNKFVLPINLLVDDGIVYVESLNEVLHNEVKIYAPTRPNRNYFEDQFIWCINLMKKHHVDFLKNGAERFVMDIEFHTYRDRVWCQLDDKMVKEMSAMDMEFRYSKIDHPTEHKLLQAKKEKYF